jgi:sugar/nucleoside kinase (ribokinase family)
VSAISVLVLDTVATDDALCGAFAGVLARAADPETRLVRGTEAAVAAVGIDGASPSLPSSDALEQMLLEFAPVEVKNVPSTIR